MAAEKKPAKKPLPRQKPDKIDSSLLEPLRFGFSIFIQKPLYFILISCAYLAVTQLTVLPEPGKSGTDFVTYTFIYILFILILGTTDLFIARLSLAAADGLEKEITWPVNFAILIPRFILATMLYSFGVLLGLVFLIVPGIIILVRCLFYRFLVLETDIQPVAAILESYRITTGQVTRLLKLLLLLGLFNLGGIILMLIGGLMGLPEVFQNGLFFGFLVITLPVSWIALAYTYRQFVPQKSAEG